MQSDKLGLDSGRDSRAHLRENYNVVLGADKKLKSKPTIQVTEIHTAVDKDL
jgi:hypothetical protein